MQDLANFLVALGAKIEGIGTNTMTIHGPATLGGTTYRIQPDHIEVGSLIGLAAVTRSPLRITRAGVEHLRSIRMLDTVQHHSQPQAGVPQNHLAQEFVETLRLAVPLMLTQLGQIAMITTDLAMIGHLGENAVAAAALAHTVYFVSFTFGLGLMSAVSPLAAQAFGAGDVRRIRRSLRVGLWVALLISLPMMASPLYGEQILLALGQAPQSAALAQRYLNGLAWGIAPALGFIALRSMYLQEIERRATVSRSLSPFLRGEGWGEEPPSPAEIIVRPVPPHPDCIFDAIRPLPASGER